MKSIHALIAVSLLGSVTAFSQDPAPAPAPAPVEPAVEKPATLSLDPTASKPEPLDAVPSTEDLGLIPQAPEPVEKPRGSAVHNPIDTRKKEGNKPSAAEDELTARIRFRQLKTKVSRDPKIVDLLAQAETAATDLEKREAMKAYYSLFYTKIEKMDRSLKKRATEAKNRAIHRLEQTRIDPTVPIDPRDAVEAARTASE